MTPEQLAKLLSEFNELRLRVEVLEEEKRKRDEIKKPMTPPNGYGMFDR